MIQLEQLFDNSPSDRNFQKLADFAVESGLKGVGIRFGAANAVFTASAHSANVTVPHGLGATPGSVQLTAHHDIVYEIVSTDATNIVVQGWAPGGAISATLNFDWLVIG